MSKLAGSALSRDKVKAFEAQAAGRHLNGCRRVLADQAARYLDFLAAAAEGLGRGRPDRSGVSRLGRGHGEAVVTASAPGDIGVRLDAVARYLAGEPLLIDPDRAAELLARAQDLSARLKAADDRLVIGLVGGTGVGKSTLINALAGQEISRSTALRPTTDRLVLYRHQDNDFSLDPDEETRTHQSANLARVSLADFPDFDSIEPAHRAALARHFPRLDLLLWVVDPTKYADLAFFDWLQAAPQARANSVFIFNKVDEYQARYRDQAPEIASEAAGDFRRKLAEYARWTDPEILTLSALNAGRGEDGWTVTGFSRLRERIEALTEKKLRLAVKELNLAAMTSGLVEDVRSAAWLDRTRLGLEKLDRCLDQGRRDAETLAVSEGRRLETILARDWRSGLAAEARGRAPWPLDFFLFLWDGLLDIFRRKTARDPGVLPDPDLTSLIKRLWAWRSEAAGVFGPQTTPPGRALAARLEASDAPEEAAAEGAAILVEEGLGRSKALSRRFRWRVRHHVLPLLILIYPFLPLAAAWWAGRAEGGVTTGIEFSAGWRELLSLAEAVLGLYLLETLYFTYRLNRAASTGLREMARAWPARLTEPGRSPDSGSGGGVPGRTRRGNLRFG